MEYAGRRNVTMSEQQKAQLEAEEDHLRDHESELNREALACKADVDARMEAFRLLKHHREAQGLSLADVAQRSGIDKARLSKLENDPYPNPTLSTLMRIADAIGVRLTLGIVDKEAA